MEYNPVTPMFSSLAIQLALSRYMPYHVMHKILTTGGLISDDRSMMQPLEYAEYVFRNYPEHFKRYDTPEALAENLTLFMDFPGVHRVCYSNAYFPLTNKPTVYTSLQGGGYICKQDAFVVLQTVFLTHCKVLQTDKLLRDIFITILKTNEGNVAQCCEFVNDAFFERILQLVDESSNTASKDPYSLTSKKQLVRKAQKWIPDWSDERHEPLRAMLVNSKKDTLINFNKIAWLIDSLLQYLDSDSRETYPTFFPVGDNGQKDFPVVVRLFEDNGVRFSMQEELKRCDDLESGCSERFLKTVDVKSVIGKAANAAKSTGMNVQVIKAPIKRAKHSAILILAPDGRYCKLAIDYFFELLQDLIFGMQIFQSNAKWTEIESFFWQLEHHFDPSQENIYFLRDNDFKADSEWRHDFFSGVLDRPVKKIRDVKKEEFTLQDLKKELGYLGLKNMFPGIQEHADVVFEAFEREQRVFKTADFYDAIEQCQLIALFEKLPKLADFVHKQKGCHRLVKNTCCQKNSSLSQKKTRRFSHTTCNAINYSDVKVTKWPLLTGANDYIMTCPNNLSLCYNDSALPFLLQHVFHLNADYKQTTHATQKRLFLLDIAQLEDAEKMVKSTHPSTHEQLAFRMLTSLRNVNESFKANNTQKIYLRTFHFKPFSREVEKYVFSEEVLDLIPILLTLQGDAVTEEVMKTLEASKSNNPTQVIQLMSLNAILEKFDINKSLITLVPDIRQAYSLYHLPIHPCLPPSPICAPSGLLLISKFELVFQMFQEILCEFDWTLANNRIGKANNQECQKMMLEIMEQAMNAKDVFYKAEKAAKIVEKLKNQLLVLSKKPKEPTPFVKIFDGDFTDSISLANFLSLSKNLQYCYPPGISKEQLENAYIPVWKARLLLYHAWTECIMPLMPKANEIKTLIKEGIYLRTPILDWKSEQDFLDLMVADTDQSAYVQILKKKCNSTRDVIRLPKNKSSRPFIVRGLKSAVQTDSSGAFAACRTSLTEMDLAREENEKQSLTLFAELLKFSVSSGESSFSEMLGKSGALTVSTPTFTPKSTLTPSDSVSTADEDWELKENKSDDQDKPIASGSNDHKHSQNQQQQDSLLPDKTRECKEPSSAPGKLKKKNKKSQNAISTSSSQPSTSIAQEQDPQKVSAVCEKCYRTNQAHEETRSKLNETSSEAKRWKKKYEEAMKELEVYKELEKGKKKREEVEKELKKANKDIERLNKKQESLMKQTDELKAKVENLKTELERKSSEHQVVTETLTSERDNWEALKVESDSRIKLLRENIPKDVLANLNIRLNTEMSENLIYLQNEQDRILAEDPIGKAADQVREFSIFHKDHPEEQGWAQHELRKFQQQHKTYLDSVIERIEKIQADPLITQAEYKGFPAPEQPGFSPELIKAMEDARESVNDELERQCCICQTNEERERFKCPLCLKQSTHSDCVAGWWYAKGQQICPLCIRVVG